MKKPEILVGEVKIAELRQGLRAVLELKRPMIVKRNSRAVAVLLPVETSWFGNLEHPVAQRRRLAVQLNAVFLKLARTFLVL
jgi:hypothetical protein